MFLTAVDMRGQQPVHPEAEVSVTCRPERQVELVVHQAERQEPHGMAKRRFGDDLEERLKCSSL
jgi:hypothetical protein